MNFGKMLVSGLGMLGLGNGSQTGGGPAGTSMASNGTYGTGFKGMAPRVVNAFKDGIGHGNATANVMSALNPNADPGAFQPNTPWGDLTTSKEGLGQSNWIQDGFEAQTDGATRNSQQAAWKQAQNKQILDMTTLVAEIAGNTGKVANKVQDAQA